MKKIEIIEAKNQHDCDICDRLLESLCQYESQYDSIISPTIGGRHFNLESLKYDYVYIAYAQIDGEPVGYIMGY